MVLQTVKDINLSLSHDSLIQSDKIGAANFFWSFPAKLYGDKIKAKENLQSQLDSIRHQILDSELKLSQSKVQRKSSGNYSTVFQSLISVSIVNVLDRGNKLAALSALLDREKQVDKIINDNKLNDPEEIKRIEKQIKLNKESADRWTDNIFAIKKYLTKKKGMSGKEVMNSNISESMILL